MTMAVQKGFTADPEGSMQRGGLRRLNRALDHGVQALAGNPVGFLRGPHREGNRPDTAQAILRLKAPCLSGW